METYRQIIKDYYSETPQEAMNTAFSGILNDMKYCYSGFNLVTLVVAILVTPLFIARIIIGILTVLIACVKHQKAPRKLIKYRKMQDTESCQLEITLQNISGKRRKMKHSYRSNKEIDETGELFNKVRFHLYQNKKILTAKVLKETHPRISGEELMESAKTGELPKPFIKEKITFGNELNQALKVILKDKIELKKVRGSSDTYIDLVNHDYYFIEDTLNKVFMETDIKVKFDRTALN